LSSADERLTVLAALSRALADVPALLTVLAEADDDSDAVRRLQETYGFTPLQAEVVLDLQFRRVVRANRTALDDEFQDVTDAGAVPWDPPLEVPATVHSPQLVELVIGGTTHRIEGADQDDCLDSLVSLVRERLARPERRNVVVTTDLAGDPIRILIDPVSRAHFFHDS
jgi:hypothetical protein